MTIKEVKYAQGSTSKKIQLQKLTDEEREILRFIYNPYFRTGIGAAALQRSKQVAKEGPRTFDEFVTYIKNVGSLGAQVEATCRHFILYGQHAPWLAEAIVTQDLQIGVSVATLNAVYGRGFIPVVSCMLGTDISKVKNLKFPYIVTEKYDGVRRLIHVAKDGSVKMYSRSGHVDDKHPELAEEAKLLRRGYVYDCELLAEGDFVDSIEQRQATNSLAARASVGLNAVVFDMIDEDEFFSGEQSMDPCWSRKLNLADMFGDESGKLIAPLESTFRLPELPKHIAAAPILAIANDMQTVIEIASKLWAEGKEGVMLNGCDDPYEGKRVKHLLKVKNRHTYVVECVGIAQGEGRNAGRVGHLLVDYKGHFVGVGTGLSDYDRDYFQDNPMAVVGKMIEVESFGESQNLQGGLSLNCPVFKRVIE